MIYKIYDTENASPLFAGWEETLIWSCLDGLMGCIYGDHPLFPQSAVAVLGDFSFFAGKPLWFGLLEEKREGRPPAFA